MLKSSNKVFNPKIKTKMEFIYLSFAQFTLPPFSIYEKTFRDRNTKEKPATRFQKPASKRCIHCELSALTLTPMGRYRLAPVA